MKLSVILAALATAILAGCAASPDRTPSALTGDAPAQNQAQLANAAPSTQPVYYRGGGWRNSR